MHVRDMHEPVLSTSPYDDRCRCDAVLLYNCNAASPAAGTTSMLLALGSQCCAVRVSAHECTWPAMSCCCSESSTRPNKNCSKELLQLSVHDWLYKNPARHERRRPQPSHFLKDCTRGGSLLTSSPDGQAHHQPLPCDLPLPPPLPLPPCWLPLPSPLDPPYRGPLPAARLAQFAIHSLMEPNFGSEAPMCWKYLDQESVEVFRSRHWACSFSRRSGSLQFETSIAFSASAMSPITQSTTMT
mmetsp:Transcript_127738/g.408410  ORF Transcript_127738/g.408410 Transcript_127738/m.408410 type:complete len:242 (+) Transcript_127738:28-753(+)